MTKHTPGPWWVDKITPKNDTHKFDICSGENERVQRFIACTYSGLSAEKANARLISAAPELLEALTEIVSAADGDGWDQLDAGFTKARNAIAKATGGQP